MTHVINAASRISTEKIKFGCAVSTFLLLALIGFNKSDLNYR